MKHWQYLKYVLRHKWFVFLYCARDGIIWRGITHDLSKLSRCEWFPYAERFYGKSNSYEEAMQDISYQCAWLHHQNHNDHHWQYWVLNRDSGETLILPMADNARREMLADWRGAGRALGFPDTRAWYAENRGNMQLHPDTKQYLDVMLCYLPPIDDGQEEDTTDEAREYFAKTLVRDFMKENKDFTDLEVAMDYCRKLYDKIAEGE